MGHPLRGRKIQRKLLRDDSSDEATGHGEGTGGEVSPIEWIVDQPGLRLGLGDSVNYTGDADLVFTHVYGPLPKQFVDKALLINVFGNKKAKAEEWCGTKLHEVGKWGRGLTNTIYEAGFTLRRIPLEDLVEEEFAPGRGWMPLDFPKRLLSITVPCLGHGKRITVFDGFMGRGTIGKAALELNMNYVGIDRDPDRVAIAKEYLNI